MRSGSQGRAFGERETGKGLLRRGPQVTVRVEVASTADGFGPLTAKVAGRGRSEATLQRISTYTGKHQRPFSSLF